MNSVKQKCLENYRIIYDPYSRIYSLHKAWPPDDLTNATTESLYIITEKALIATLLEMREESEK